MLNLDNVTLVAMASIKVFATVQALKYSRRDIKFARTLLISHKRPWYLPNDIDFEFTSKNKNIYEWCYKIIYSLHEYIDTEFVILIHNDGFIVNPEQWCNDFYDYDYIGAPWPIPLDDSYQDHYGNLVRVGNSVSLRSHRILRMPTELNIPWEPESGFFHEDGFLCCNNKHILEENGIRFPDINIAKFFSHESMIQEIEGITPFSFHKWQGSNKKYPGYWLDKITW